MSIMPTDLPLHNALLEMYCSFGDIEEAVRVFSVIEHPDGERLFDMFSHLH